jgi:glycosyltransferase involved in cell wall biosynthesis
VAWARFQPRTAAIADAFGGEALFVSSRLRGGPALAPARYLAGAARTWRLLEERRPQRVVVITPPVAAPLLAWAWCRLRRRQLVVDCHTDTFHSPRWSWARPIHRWLLRRVVAALVHTEEARELVQSWGAPALLLPDDLPAPADAIPPPSHPTKPTGFAGAPGSRGRWPARAGGGAGGSPGPTVLVAGSLDANEPVAESVAMAALLPRVEFRVTGDVGHLPAGLTDGAPANVTFTGYLPYRQFLGEMLAADVVAVFSTDPHIMNRAAFEAVGLGRPLVLSDFQGLRSRFGAGAGFAVNLPAAMAAAIEDALARRAELAARSRELARDLARQREGAMGQLRAMLDEPARRPATRGVLLLTQHLFPGHPTVERAVSELRRQGFTVDLVCSAPPAGSPKPEPSPPGLRVYRVPVRHRRRPLIRYPLEYAAFFLAALGIVSWLGLRRRYAAVQVDNLPDVLVFAAPVPRWRGARLVFNMYELTPEMTAARFRGRLGRPLVRITRWVEGAAVRWADHVIVVSRPCFDALRARGVAPERMSVVLNTSAAAAAEPEEVGGGPPTLITHGTLVERYGVDVLIRAMAILRSALPAVSLRVVGGGEQMESLQRLTRALGLADVVTFTGILPWPETLREVRRATLGVVSVLADGYGQLMLPGKLLEYARFGIPAVCSRLPAIEAYFSADTVAYFRPGDEQELAAQVVRLLRDPELARRQAACAEETVRRMAWDHVRFDYLRALGLEDATSVPVTASRRILRENRGP